MELAIVVVVLNSGTYPIVPGPIVPSPPGAQDADSAHDEVSA
jgi:hypothetical protein